MGIRRRGGERLRPPQTVDRVAQTIAGRQEIGARVPSHRQIGLERQRTPERLVGAVIVVELEQELAAAGPRFREIGLERQRGAETGIRLGKPQQRGQ